MIKLSDTQAILLAAASQCEDGSLLPLHANIRPSGGAMKFIAALVKHGLAEERETTDAAAVYRTNGDTHFRVYVTPAGLAAIGVGEDDDKEQASGTASIPPPETVAAEKAPTKIATVLDLLGQPGGVLVPDLIAATGWLPHTLRAAITGLRKKGHDVQRTKRNGVTGYCLSVTAQ